MVNWTRCTSAAAGIALMLSVGSAIAQSSLGGTRKPVAQIGGPKPVYNPVMPAQHNAPSTTPSVTALPSRNQSPNTSATKGTTNPRAH